MSDKEFIGQTEPTFLPEIRRARFDSLTIYEVSESELDILEKGSPDSIYLNFAIFLLSVAISLTTALFTTTTTSNAAFIVFVVLTTIGYLGGVFLVILWRRNHTSVSDCAATIRKRLPPAGTAQPLSRTEGKDMEV